MTLHSLIEGSQKKKWASETLFECASMTVSTTNQEIKATRKIVEINEPWLKQDKVFRVYKSHIVLRTGLCVPEHLFQPTVNLSNEWC